MARKPGEPARRPGSRCSTWPRWRRPTQPPMASHQRGSRLASSRRTRYSVTAQNTKSGVVVVSSCMAPRYSRAGGGGERGEHLAGPARAEHPAHRRGRAAPGRPGQRGQHPEPDQRVAGQHGRQPGQQRGERRLVDVAEGQVLAGGQEVQLVADVAVAGADRHLDGEGGGRDQRDRRAGRRAEAADAGVAGGGGRGPGRLGR